MELATWSLVIFTIGFAATITYIIVPLVAFCLRLRRVARVLSQFPSDPTHWLLGHLHVFPGFNDAGLAYLRDSVVRHPRYTVVWDTALSCVLQLRHPDVIKLILQRSDPKPTERGVYRFGKPWLGEGLIMSNGAKWHRNRKLLTNMFHFEFLRTYVTTVNSTSELLLDRLSTHAANGTGLSLYTSLSLCTLDAMLRAAFSYDNDVQSRGEGHPYVKAVGELSSLWVERAISLVGQFSVWNWTEPGRRFHRHCAYVHRLADDVIQKRRREQSDRNDDDPANEQCLDFLDLLLKARDADGQGLTDKEIRDEVTTFLFAGHDTTASALAWTLYELAVHPEFQDKCRHEVKAILHGRISPDITWDDLSRLPYLTMCIKEAQRLHTVVPFIQRELQEDLVMDGVTLPAGLHVSITLYCLHHNPTVWENPTEYQPQRFTAENMDKMDNFAFLPFSAGSRNCIGQHFSMHEQKVIIARILARFELSVDPTFKLESDFGITLRPKDSLKLFVQPV